MAARFPNAPCIPLEGNTPLYTTSTDLSISDSGQSGSASLDSPLETTAHCPDEDAISTRYTHAYRTFGCKHCTAVHEYVALARCGDRTCGQCRQVDYWRLYNAYV